MSLLHKIQEDVTQEGISLSSVLLKLRLLASRLGSDTLEDWVKHESEGYPKDSEVPSYRVVELSYKGTFLGPFGSALKNTQIPIYLVKQHVSDAWASYQVRESIAGVEELLSMSTKGGTLEIDASNLLLLLQDKVYEGYTCSEIRASMSRTAISEIQQTVRARILELTLEIEKTIPEAANVSFDTPQNTGTQPDIVQQITQQVIYGDVATAVVGSRDTQITIDISKYDNDSFIKYLVESGIPREDAVEFSEIVGAEEPLSADEPFGKKAKSWLLNNLRKTAEGTWNIGLSVATKVFTEAALKYYGLK
ncbi:MAG: hypothetical protein JAZ19_03840 [Candidatus Thiodiazotropha taylori]|nr:hypothetical protein [Candidatus Thiodiazotropha taylori]